MSSSWTQPQGDVGDLGKQSSAELHELILRQEKMLSNRGFLQSLPDKGKKIREFVEKLRLAVERHEEEERKRSLASAARTEFQSKYQQAFLLRQPAAASGDAVREEEEEEETSPVSDPMLGNTLDEQQDHLVSGAAAGETMETAAAGDSLDNGETKESDLAEALGRIKLSETSSSSKFKDSLNSSARDTYVPNKPHYLTVLERTENTPVIRKQQFKPNQLPHRSDVSPSGSSSPVQSSEGSLPLSAHKKKERDRKHLDDITSARLPPLHYSPVQLLSLDESAVLLKDQTKRQQELQAKQAAQKLSEGLKISMGSYTPDGGPMAAYREVRDEEAELSEGSEED